MIIKNEKDLVVALAQGHSTWPGCYPLFFIMSDGASLCPSCASKEKERLLEAIKERSSCGWRPVGIEINYEDGYLICCHCNERIPSAYAEPD